MIPGPTLADATGPRRIRKLIARREELRMMIAELEDKKETIEGEINLIKVTGNSAGTLDKGAFLQDLNKLHGRYPVPVNHPIPRQEVPL